MPSRTSASERPVDSSSCVEPCGLAVLAREGGKKKVKDILCLFIFILGMKGFNVITALFWLKENGMSGPNGTLGIYGMVLKPRS